LLSSRNRKNASDQVVVIVTTTSKLAAREKTINPRQVAVTTRLDKPALISRATKATATIVSNPHNAGPNRADHSFTPKTLKLTAMSQYNSDGFSNHVYPPSVGVM
jgi:hypothetical protein